MRVDREEQLPPVRRAGGHDIDSSGSGHRQSPASQAPEELKGVVGGFAQALEVEQTVVAMKGLAPVTDLVVDVG
jgi:hypothetical protein